MEMKTVTDENMLINEWFAEIGSNITWYRRKKGLTQEALAARVDISRVHLAAIEAPNSSRRPSMDLLFRIALALGVEPAELMKVSGAPPQSRTAAADSKIAAGRSR